MIIHPMWLLFIWMFIYTIGYSVCVRLGAHAARAGVELLQASSEGRPIGSFDGVLVAASAGVAILCLWACIYAALKIRELLE